MKTILLVLNAKKPDKYLAEFACQMALAAGARLHALVIENIYETEPVISMYPGVAWVEARSGIRKPALQTDAAIRLFRDTCHAHAVLYKVMLDTSNPADDVIFESRYADFMILHPGTSFDDEPPHLPTLFVQNILHKAECPVLIAPELYEDVNEIVFCYDGTGKCIRAIKEFAYLFPAFHDRDVKLVQVFKKHPKSHTRDHARLMSWLEEHYRSATYLELIGDAKDELYGYLYMKRKKIIVMGAYSRTMISNLLQESTASTLIRDIDLPIFNYHL